MRTIRILSSSFLAVALLTQPALAQNKGTMTKTVTEFHKLSQTMAGTVADLTKRSSKSSPNDKEMLALVINQLRLIDTTMDGVLALGVVAAEVRDAGDLAIAKKYLNTRCMALQTITESSGKYIGSLANNIAAVATSAEVNKAVDLVDQVRGHALCGNAPAKK